MKKDPAFLFYSKDFYEGTRTMLPEERACYIDLMIYQHQNGFIPKDDIKRVLLYCNGIKKATLIATLEAKFVLNEQGWINPKLSSIIQEREQFSIKQSVNGQIGQFWKKMKAFLNKKDYECLRDSLYNLSNENIYNLIKDKDINIDNAKAMLEALLKHLENANANAIIISNKGGVGETLPEEDQHPEQPQTRTSHNYPIHIREQLFTAECSSFSDRYPESMIKDFVRYWTEPNKSKTKMRYEGEKTWDTERRLITWKNNELKFTPNGNKTGNTAVSRQSAGSNGTRKTTI